MIEEAEESATGVVCLRCGTHTPLPGSRTGHLSHPVNDSLHFPVHIVRCAGCGKEGSYLAGEIIEFRMKPGFLTTAA
jgi:hypothetical protein